MVNAHTWRTAIAPWISVLPIGALVCLAVALARPQRQWEEKKVRTEAVDIALVIDVSPSMLSRDLEPDRLTVARKVAGQFVRQRPNDRIGLVIFSAEAFTLCPLTTDHDMVRHFLDDIRVGRLEDGTAIGMGLATAIYRLKSSTAKSKVIVLLTDGENNAGYISPQTAIEMAQLFGIRVYIIGVGTTGIVLSPVQRNPDGTYLYAPRQSDFDTTLLAEMAAVTQGKFYRAANEKELSEVYRNIDELEKSAVEISVIRHNSDYFSLFILLALSLLLLEVILRWAWLRTLTP